jgi:alkyldihydroxyacetonephosphate synthase
MAAHRLELEELRRALEGVVGAERVSTRASDRGTYARDMWPRLLFAVRAGAPAGVPPDVVVWPETAEEVAEIIHVAGRLRVPVVPYGAGSGVAGGAVPVQGGITIDTKRMDRILAVDERDLVCHAQAGIVGERLERDLERRGLTLGHFPSSIYCSTLGGWLAARSAGQMSSRYGKIEDLALGVTAVTGRGDIVTTGQNGRAQAGPDWTQLLLGSEGTLGVIISARLRLHPAPEIRILRGFAFPRLVAGLEAIRRVLQRGLRPATVRLYDELDSWIALRKGGRAPDARAQLPPPAGTGALPSLEGAPADPVDDGFLARVRRRVPGTGKRARWAREALAAALDRPRLLNTVVDLGAQRLGRQGCLLIVGCEGARARAEAEARLVFAELERAGGRDLGEEPGVRWYAHRYAVAYNMSRMFEAGAFVDTMEVAATWERLLDLYQGVRAAVSRHALVMAHFSHAYPEGCSIYFTFAGHAPSRAESERKYDALWREGLAAATRAGGTVSHHHGVGLMKAGFMVEEHREAMAIYEALKQSLDPDGIMNPGKMGLRPRGEGWATITRG